MIIIGFGYKARHGKDTAAAHLINAYTGRYDMRRYAFGDELKVEFYDALLDLCNPYWLTSNDFLLLPHPKNTFASRQEKIDWVNEHKEALGKHLQWYGTEFRRSQDHFYWVKKLAQTVAAENPQIVLITDVRFPNELYWIKALRGYTIKCTRTGFLDPSRDNQHESETGLDNYLFDFEIQAADGNLAELTTGVEEVFEVIVADLTPNNPEESIVLPAAA